MSVTFVALVLVCLCVAVIQAKRRQWKKCLIALLAMVVLLLCGLVLR